MVKSTISVYRLKRSEGKVVERRLVDRKHNMILTSGLNQIRDFLRGTITWKLNAIGLGSSATAVAASQTWGQTPLLCQAPTAKYFRGGLYRSSLLIEENDLVGDTIREVWIAPETTGSAYARVVIDPVAKTDDYAYLFIIDCTWSGTGIGRGWEVIAAQAASEGSYQLKITEALFGSGTAPVTEDDETLANPWTMTAVPVGSSGIADGQLTLNFTLGVDQYNGLTLAEVGLYYDVVAGTAPASLPCPGLFSRSLLASPYEIEVGTGGQVVAVLSWEDENL